MIESVRELEDVVDGPANGDVLITTERDVHYLSIVPRPHLLSFGALSRAVEVARLWAASHKVEIWRAQDGRIIKLPKDGSAA
jgi:hypothetical protein